MTAYRLLVFDWDGTLMDSVARIVSSMQAAFRELGLTVPGAAAVRNVIGLGLSEAIAVLLPSVEEELLWRVASHYRQHFLDTDATPTSLFPGVEDALRHLRSSGYLLGVATGKGREGLNRALAETGLPPYFQATRCADETRSKPHPQMLFELMAELAVAAEHTLMIGDSEYDMAMAANAGVDALAVCYGVHDANRLNQHKPLACLESIGELPAWLARWG
jgi:phosphoglycolate phosphatase